MGKHWMIFLLGFLVMLVPFLGFPPSLDTKILFLLGLVIMILVFLAARDFYLAENKRPNV